MSGVRAISRGYNKTPTESQREILKGHEEIINANVLAMGPFYFFDETQLNHVMPEIDAHLHAIRSHFSPEYNAMIRKGME